MAAVDAGPVASSQARFGDVSASPRRDGVGGGQRAGHDPVDGPVEVDQGNLGGSGAALGFGAHMPHLPGGTRPGHGGDDLHRRVLDPLIGDDPTAGPPPGGTLAGSATWNGRPDHLPNGGVTSQDPFRLSRPGGPLLGIRAGGVLAWAGLQDGPSAEAPGLKQGGRAGTVNLERRRQSGDPTLISAVRDDQNRLSRGSTPTTSRTGRQGSAVLAWKRTPSRALSSASILVL